MVQIPDDLKYTNDHEWVKEEGDTLVIGITDFAQDSLGEIVYIELPSEGDEITKGDPFGAVESTKAVSDLNAPVSGDIVEVNELLLDSPETINEDPYSKGWMVRVRPYDPDELSALMDTASYTEFVEKELEE